jgi:hypothetical protein
MSIAIASDTPLGVTHEERLQRTPVREVEQVEGVDPDLGTDAIAPSTASVRQARSEQTPNKIEDPA